MCSLYGSSMSNLNIPIAKLLEVYCQEEHLQSYSADGQRLKRELQDLQRVIDFAGSDFTSLATSVKKRLDEYMKALRFSKNAIKEFFDPTKTCEYFANQRLAYNVLARSCRELEDDECLIDHRMISNEMKLKFLESRGIVHIQWHQVYKPNERSLLFCSPDSRVQIRVGFDLSHMNLKPMWAVKDVLFQGKSHLLLFLYYCEQLLAWVVNTHKEAAEEYVLHYLEKSLRFTSILLLYISMRQLPHLKELKKHTLVFQEEETKISWHFLMVQSSDQASISIAKGEKTFLKFHSSQTEIKGIYEVPDDKLNVKLQATFDGDTFDSTRLLALAKDMSLHADTINSFRTKYKLNSDHDICFVIRTAKTYWLPQGGKSLKALLLERAKMDSNDSELYLAYSDEMIFKIDQSLNLNSKTTPKGLPNYLFQRQLQRAELGLDIKYIFMHFLLAESLLGLGSESEIKIYEIDCKKKDQFVYEFREPVFVYVNRFNRSRLNDDSHERRDKDNQKQDTFIIKVKLESNFQSVKFFANRPKHIEQEIPQNFMPQRWLSYRKGLSNKEQISYKQLSACIRYICKHYLFLRIYYHRMSKADQRSIQFTFLCC